MHYKYVLGTIFTIPLLPLIYYQGERIRRQVPSLPEAKDPKGIAVKVGKKLNVLVIGESTMAGVGVATHQEGFAGTLATTLAKKLNRSVDWEVCAKSGYTAKRVRNELIPTIAKKVYDLIVIGLGGNDAFTLNRPNIWGTDIDHLIIALKALSPQCPIVFINMPPIKEFPAFTKAIKWTIGNLVEILGDELNSRVSKHESVYYTSERIVLKEWCDRLNIHAEPSAFFSDGVHPSALTYQTWAKEIVHFIISNKIVT